jgi:hypothetical protein
MQLSVSAKQASDLSNRPLAYLLRHLPLHENNRLVQRLEEFQAALAEHHDLRAPIVRVRPSLHVPQLFCPIDQFLHTLLGHVGARSKVSQSGTVQFKISIQIQMHSPEIGESLLGQNVQDFCLDDPSGLEDGPTDVLATPGLIRIAESRLLDYFDFHTIAQPVLGFRRNSIPPIRKGILKLINLNPARNSPGVKIAFKGIVPMILPWINNPLS